MTKIERSIEINRPVQDVWDYVHEPRNDAQWQTTIVESQPQNEGPLQLGTEVRETRKFLGIRLQVGYQVTELEPTTRSSIRSVSGPVPFTGSYLFEPHDGSTRFTVTGELDAHGFFKVAEPVFARMAGRELEANLGHLKDILETRGTQSGA